MKYPSSRAAVTACFALLPCAFTTSLTHADAPPAAAPAVDPPLGAYRWGAGNPTGGPDANIAYAKWLGRGAVWAEDFEPNEGWAGRIEGGGWQLGPWSDWKRAAPGRRLILSVPLLPGPWDRSGPKEATEAGAVSLAAGAKGDYNAHFRILAQNLVAHGLGDSILRLGWEFNGGWYTWRASDDPAAFAQYFQQIVTTMHAVPGAKDLKFDWNVALGYQQFPAEKAWPGDGYADYVGVDVYDDSWATDTYPFSKDATPAQIAERQKRVWQNVLWGGDHGLRFWRDFATRHHALLTIPEWGVSKREDTHGGLDDPAFIEQMYAFLRDPASHVAYSSCFDVQAGDGHHQLSPGIKGAETTEFPASAARFRTLFGNAAPTKP